MSIVLLFVASLSALLLATDDDESGCVSGPVRLLFLHSLPYPFLPFAAGHPTEQRRANTRSLTLVLAFLSTAIRRGRWLSVLVVSHGWHVGGE